MRSVLVLALISSAIPARADACKATDITMVRGAASKRWQWNEPDPAIVPSRPSLFVHLGASGPKGMPEFSTPDGTPIGVTRIVPVVAGDWPVDRVDLDIDRGVIVVRLPGEALPVAKYTIDPAFKPTTRSVERLPAGLSLWVDSDAVAFRVDGEDLAGWEVFNDQHVLLPTDVPRQRVTALYADGTEQVIFDEATPPSAPSEAEASSVDVHDESDVSGGFAGACLLLLATAIFGLVATPRVD